MMQGKKVSAQKAVDLKLYRFLQCMPLVCALLYNIPSLLF
jgi:hypothetical protein